MPTPVTRELARRPISPKLIAPLAATLSAFAYNTISTGVTDRESLALLAVAVINAALAYCVPFGDESALPEVTVEQEVVA